MRPGECLGSVLSFFQCFDTVDWLKAGALGPKTPATYPQRFSVRTGGGRILRRELGHSSVRLLSEMTCSYTEWDVKE